MATIHCLPCKCYPRRSNQCLDASVLVLALEELRLDSSYHLLGSNSSSMSISEAQEQTENSSALAPKSEEKPASYWGYAVRSRDTAECGACCASASRKVPSSIYACTEPGRSTKIASRSTVASIAPKPCFRLFVRVPELGRVSASSLASWTPDLENVGRLASR